MRSKPGISSMKSAISTADVSISSTNGGSKVKGFARSMRSIASRAPARIASLRRGRRQRVDRGETDGVFNGDAHNPWKPLNGLSTIVLSPVTSTRGTP